MAYGLKIVVNRFCLIGTQGIRSHVSLVGVDNGCRASVEGVELVFTYIAFVVMSYVLYGIGDVFLRCMSEELTRIVWQVRQFGRHQTVQLSVMLQKIVYGEIAEISFLAHLCHCLIVLFQVGEIATPLL